MKPTNNIWRSQHFNNYLWLLLICLLSYWPLTFGVFSVKNDAIHEFLPYRFAIAEAIRNGEFPFWSPYLYLGNPVYGDMQSGAWNPVVWLFSFFSRFNITVFHLEYLLYIFLGGIGMYKLIFLLSKSTQSSLLIAASYMLSGFMVGGQLIHWNAAAAYLPFVIYYYQMMRINGTIASAIKAGIALYLMFVSSYPSFFFVTGYILLAIFCVDLITKIVFRNKYNISWKKTLSQNIICLLTFLTLSLPAIISYYDLLPYYSRGNGTTYLDTLHNSFEPQHLITFFFPALLNPKDLLSSTDIFCRNVYIGIFVIPILLLYRPVFNRSNILITILAIFSIAFSLGELTPIRKLCYDFLPLMDTFRHPSQMRLFFIFAILLLVTPGLTRFLAIKNPTKKTEWILISFTLIIAFVTVLAISNSSMLSNSNFLHSIGTTKSIKLIMTELTKWDLIAICGIAQTIFMLLCLFWLKRQVSRKSIFSFLWITNLMMMATFALPVSFVSTTSPGEINKIINSSPKGFPAELVTNSLAENSVDALSQYEKISVALFYNKKIGITHIAYTPSFFSEHDTVLLSPTLYQFIASKPAVYLSNLSLSLDDTLRLAHKSKCNPIFLDTSFRDSTGCDTAGYAKVVKMGSNYFTIQTNAIVPKILALTQSYHHHWKLWVDGKSQPVKRVNFSFIGASLTKGNHIVEFKFIPYNTIICCWVMLAGVMSIIIFFTISWYITKVKS